MRTPLEVIREGVHMKGLALSKTAKLECGELTVLPLGHLTTIHKTQTLALLKSLRAEYEGRKVRNLPQPSHDAFIKNKAIQDIIDSLDALIKEIT